MNHFEMIEYIKDRLERATEAEVEAIFWIIESEFP